MKETYIIKDARKLLAEQISNTGMIERTAMSTNPITNAKGLSAVIPKDNDGYCTVYKMDCVDGLGLMTVYQVYPGIQIIYNDFESASCKWEGNPDKNILEINHCREGREGSCLLGGSCLYLGEGDLSIHAMDNCAPEMTFPLKHYRGISVVINLEMVAENPPEILSESGIDILEFREKFCANGNCFIMRAKDEIEHIFSELYSVPDCLQKSYFKLKVQELLLFLSMIDVSREKQREQYTAPQVEIVKEIQRKLVSNLQERPTIGEALLNEPDFLTVDEPTTGLDPEERIRIRNLLVDFSQKRTVLFSTHVVEDLAATCNCLAVMKSGKILYSGNVMDLLEKAKGRVWNCYVKNDLEARELEKRYHVSGKQFVEGGIRMKLLSDFKPDVKCEPCEITLEDAYIYITNKVEKN